MGDATKKILTAGPSITDLEIGYVMDAVRNGWNAHHSDYINKFEQSFAAYVGAKYALATSSCTGALHLGLLGLGLGPGDEVLVPEITWIATASAVTYTGATPVFVDIDPETWVMNLESARRAITPYTKAIMPVHLYGHPVDMSGVMELAEEFGLKVFEDAAPALGAEVRGRKVGGIGHAAAFSFQGAKIMTCGEGGMFVTSDEELYERVKFLGDHGRDAHIPFFNSEIGYKYKMSNLAAAMGLAQLERIEELVDRKRLIYSWYQQRLAGVPGLALNVERPWARNIYWMSSVVLPEDCELSRDVVISGLRERGIDSRPFFRPISSFPMFATQAVRNPHAYDVTPRGINLPSGHNLTEEEVERVCDSLLEVLQGVGAQRAAA